MINRSKQDEALDGFDENKRRTLTRLGLGAAFVTPIVASFSMDGLTISKVHAQTANGSGIVCPPNSTSLDLECLPPPPK
jgi:hypothetical protein